MIDSRQRVSEIAAALAVAALTLLSLALSLQGIAAN